MTGINRLLNWMEENKDLKISLEYIKLQAQVFALEEQYSLERFNILANILNQKSNKNNNEKSELEKLYINYLHAQK
jgi:hypothetical protein